MAARAGVVVFAMLSSALAVSWPAIAATGDRPCPSADPTECYKLCFTAGDAADDLLRDLQTEASKGWLRLHQHFQKWRWCMEGSASETYSAIVRLLLARHWKAQATSLFDIARQDPSFFDFVLVRLHAPEPWEEDGQRVAKLALKACPGRAKALCARLAREAESASQKPAEE